METVKTSLSMPIDLFNAFDPKHNYECITPDDIKNMDCEAMLEFMKEVGNMKKESRIITWRKDTKECFDARFSDILLKYVLSYCRFIKEGITDAAE